MIESMKVQYGYINPSIAGGKYIKGNIRIPTDVMKYGDFMDIGIIPYMIPNSDNLKSIQKMLEDIEAGAVYVSWDVTGDGVFGMYKSSVIYSNDSLELQINRMYLNSLQNNNG